ncbi:GHKL domain-containing protein [Microbacterium hominis]|uniref:histidine kinase n=1 Tax=Microbacterium hominis TaxID=162426 RepID=A0A2K9DZW3_9MICO|nr:MULTISPECIES: ATP-binding protein [Microbacterium]AUG30213.1 GHKL domain-containing protein [Microbacterium hominis]QRY41517.1 GHKL domain-containing protein [Microbacterium hominis]
MARSIGRSAASRLFLWLAGAALVLALGTAGLLVLEAQRAARAEAERATQAVAATLAGLPEVRSALAAGDGEAATRTLQPIAREVMSSAGVDFVTVMDTAGIRITHRDPAQIGQHYIGTIPPSPQTITEEFTGTLGPSLRTIVPVEADGRLVGWVSVGVTVRTVTAQVVPRLLVVAAVGLALVGAGLAGAVLARRATRSVAGDLPAGAIRDTLASAESMRTLGEALRAQTHEHGNRMHAAVALIELGRSADAIGILTDSARQSQALVDQVAARTDGDPTVGALLLGKASQAMERGIEWSADIAADAPRSLLRPIDAVALVGNLIDNALDAAAAGPEPRWVRVHMSRTAEDELLLSVADSGEGPDEHTRARMFERGFSTKPAGADGRGVGLALVRAVVDEVGGTISLGLSPTTFRVVLPTGLS